MATPKLLSVREFNTSRFAQLADNTDASVAQTIARAEAAIESKLKRPIAPTLTSEILTPSTNVLYLKNRPVISVEGFWRGFSKEALANGPNGIPVGPGIQHYRLNSQQGTIESSTSIRGYAVRVDYIAGYQETPEDIKEAIVLQTALFLYQDLEIYGSGDSKEPGILYYKRDIEDLLKPYKQLHMAYTR